MRTTGRTLGLALAIGGAWASPSGAITFDPKFAIDPASPSVDGNVTPDDVLKPGPVVFQQGTSLNLQDGFFTGEFDNLNALSYGRDPVTRPPPGADIPIYFSVDRVAVGNPDTAVFTEAMPGSEEAAGDVFRTRFPLHSGTNTLAIDEQDLGLIQGFFGDDLDAVEIDTVEFDHSYFSIDFFSESNGFGTLDFANDIFIDAFPMIFAEGVTDIGLMAGDDLDALILWDQYQPGELNPGMDLALFSVSTFSPNTFTFTGNEYIPGQPGHLSPADILFTEFGGSFSLWAAADEVGLREDDELDALDTVVPEPATMWLFAAGGGLLALRRRQSPARVRPMN